MRMVENSLKAYDYEIDEEMKNHFKEFRKTHNQGVFDVYTPEMKAARHSAIITGLPDAYGRGRIIGDYRRLALYGVDRLIEAKKEAHGSRTDRGDEGRRAYACVRRALRLPAYRQGSFQGRCSRDQEHGPLCTL